MKISNLNLFKFCLLKNVQKLLTIIWVYSSSNISRKISSLWKKTPHFYCKKKDNSCHCCSTLTMKLMLSVNIFMAKIKIQTSIFFTRNGQYTYTQINITKKTFPKHFLFLLLSFKDTYFAKFKKVECYILYTHYVVRVVTFSIHIMW